MTTVIIFKNGKELKIKCDEFTTKTNGYGNFTGYEIKGIKENKPLYISFDQIVCIYRVIADEVEE